MSKKRGRLSAIGKELATPTPTAPEPTGKLEPSAPIGERGDYLRVTITLGPAHLRLLREVGMARKAAGETGTSVSALIREAVSKQFGQ